MHDHNRRGSILLLCLAIVTTLSITVFTYLRIVSLSDETNDSDKHLLLAREAAKYGLNHAIEQIVRDHVDGPFTRSDDSAHAAFVSFTNPYMNDYDSDNVPGGPTRINMDDVAAEGNLIDSFGGFGGWQEMAYQNYLYDGRGRYYEPEFYNLATVGFDPSRSQVTTPVRFGDAVDGTWTGPTPDRNRGIFYDHNLRSIGGDPAVARGAARYRLRYAVGVRDLDGQLLVTGDPGLDYRAFDTYNPDDVPPGVANDPVRRIIRWQHAIPGIVNAGGQFGNTGDGVNTPTPSGGARVAHLFLNRGMVSNVDRDPTTNTPVTFPYMLRTSALGNFANAAGSGPAEDVYRTDHLGGVVMPPHAYNYSLLGPQFSFVSFDRAAYGAGADSGYVAAQGRYTPFGRGLSRAADPSQYDRWRGPVDVPWCVNPMTAPATVIYGMLAAYMPPGAICTWHKQSRPTNLLLTPSGSGAWLGKSRAWDLLGTRDLFIGEMSPAFASYDTPSNGPIRPHFRALQDRLPHRRYPGIIGFNGRSDEHWSGWVNDDLGCYLRAQQEAPAVRRVVRPCGRPEVVRSLSDGGKEPGVRPVPAQPRYLRKSFWYRSSSFLGISANTPAPPGVAITMPPEWVSTTTYAVNDRVTYQGIGYRALQAVPGLPPTATPQEVLDYAPPRQMATSTPPVSPPRWVAEVWSDPLTTTQVVGAHPDSIWDAVGSAMGAAIAVARGQYRQYPNSLTTPGTDFNNGPWTGTRITDLRDLDALFVENLGSDFERPNSTTPMPCWKASGDRLVSFTPTWNLAGLRTAMVTVEVVEAPLASPGGPSNAATYYADHTTNPPRVHLNVDPAYDPMPDHPPALPGIYTFPLAARNHPDEPRFRPGGMAPSSTYASFTAEQRTAIAELVINDIRMSFFGSSPGYRDDRGDGRSFFRALDLNGDGKAHCSGFRSTGNEVDLHLDQYTTFIDPVGVATVEVDDAFSTTGNFFIGRSRFWRVMVRGELFDNLLQMPVSCAQIDSVICVDPMNDAGEFVPGATTDFAAGQHSTHVLYQRWFFNAYRGLNPRMQD